MATSGEDGDWDVRIVASRRSNVVARVPAPALGWTALGAPADYLGILHQQMSIELLP